MFIRRVHMYSLIFSSCAFTSVKKDGSESRSFHIELCNVLETLFRYDHHGLFFTEMLMSNTSNNMAGVDVALTTA